LAIQDYFGVSDPTFILHDGIVFFAMRHGCDVKAAIAEGERLMSNKVLRRAIRKARIAGRDLQTLRSSADLAQYEEGQQSEKVKKKLDKQQKRLTLDLLPQNCASHLILDNEDDNTIDTCTPSIFPTFDDDGFSKCSSIVDDDFARCVTNIASWTEIDQTYLYSLQFGKEQEEGSSADLVDTDFIQNKKVDEFPSTQDVRQKSCRQRTIPLSESNDASIGLSRNQYEESSESILYNCDGCPTSPIQGDNTSGVTRVVSSNLDSVLHPLSTSENLFISSSNLASDDDDDNAGKDDSAATMMTNSLSEPKTFSRVLTRLDSSDRLDDVHHQRRKDLF
jgi:hypothetical protein